MVLLQYTGVNSHSPVEFVEISKKHQTGENTELLPIPKIDYLGLEYERIPFITGIFLAALMLQTASSLSFIRHGLES